MCWLLRVVELKASFCTLHQNVVPRRMGFCLYIGLPFTQHRTLGVLPLKSCSYEEIDQFLS